MTVDDCGSTDVDILAVTLADLLAEGAAQRLSDHTVRLLPPQPPTMYRYVRLDVTFLGTGILNSGKVFRSALVRPIADHSSRLPVPPISMPVPVPTNPRSTMLDAAKDLDSSDLVSLDLTSRAALGLADVGCRLKASRPSNLSQVVEESVGQDLSTPALAAVSCAASQDVSTVFSPRSDRCTVSTMRDTVAAASCLQKALAVVNELPSMVDAGSGDMVIDSRPAAACVDDNRQQPVTMTAGDSGTSNMMEESLLQPSTSADRLSVEDIQRSLSREGSPNMSVWEENAEATFGHPIAAAERSISFAPTTKQIIFEEVVATPAAGDRSRYTVVEGRTKVQDGTARLAKKILNLPKQQNQPVERDVGTPAEVGQQHVAAGSWAGQQTGGEAANNSSVVELGAIAAWNESVCVNLNITEQFELDCNLLGLSYSTMADQDGASLSIRQTKAGLLSRTAQENTISDETSKGENDVRTGGGEDEKGAGIHDDLNASKARPFNGAIPADSGSDETNTEQSCVGDNFDEREEEMGIHDDLNASKARPFNGMIPADSCWDETNIVERTAGDEFDEEEEVGIHDSLNASKARPFNGTIPADSCWDESCLEERNDQIDWKLLLADKLTTANITNRYR